MYINLKILIGTDTTAYGIAIPPGLDKFELKSFCHNKCIRSVRKKIIREFRVFFLLFNLFLKVFANNPITNITVISANPHTHLTGISVDTKIIRNGVDIGYLFANHEYDFNYQQSYLLNPYVNITIVNLVFNYFNYQESMNYKL